MLMESLRVYAATRRPPTLRAAWAWLFVVLCGFVPAASGQEFRASIGGIVTDPTGASVV